MVPEVLLYGVPLVVVAPALVQLAKDVGLPTRLAGLASISACALLLGLLGLASDAFYGGVASWLLASIVYGLAGSGLYSQIHKLTGRQ